MNIGNTLANWVYRVGVGFVMLMMVASLLFPRFATQINSLATLILVLATLTYAWLTRSLVKKTEDTVEQMRAGNELSNRAIEQMRLQNELTRETIDEMQETRKQAATPIIRVQPNGGGPRHVPIPREEYRQQFSAERQDWVTDWPFRHSDAYQAGNAGSR